MRKMSKVQGLCRNQPKGKCGLIIVSRACVTVLCSSAQDPWKHSLFPPWIVKALQTTDSGAGGGWWLSSRSTWLMNLCKRSECEGRDRHKVTATGNTMHHGRVFFCRH